MSKHMAEINITDKNDSRILKLTSFQSLDRVSCMLNFELEFIKWEGTV